VATRLVACQFQGPYFVSQVNAVNVEISVLLGRSILANNHPIARGEIQISDDRIAIQVTRAADVYDYMAGGA
jgi:flagellar motor switch protein FliN/FliY